jgi:ubiquinol oxidase
MELVRGNEELERLNETLNDPEALAQYKAPYDNYRPALVPRLLGAFLVGAGNFFYGKEPSYLKFRAVEVIARVPYHSWVSAAYTLLTFCYRSEERAMRLSKMTRYARLSQDNETMHVVVISHLCSKQRASWLRHTLVPMWFAFFYFWWSYALYLINPRYSYELNYLFEGHAFEQYSRFLETHGDELKKKPVMSEFLTWYGRHPRSEYEFFRSVRNDEIIHRNHSLQELDA